MVKSASRTGMVPLTWVSETSKIAVTCGGGGARTVGPAAGDRGQHLSGRQVDLDGDALHG